MSNEQMDRDWRRDESLKHACNEAVIAIERVLDQPYRFNQARIDVLREARLICKNTAGHIVAVWD